MTIPDLSDVTLVCVDTRTPTAALSALERSRRACRFHAALLFSDVAAVPDGIGLVRIPRLADAAAYSHFLMKELVRHVATPFTLVIQWDGFVVDGAAWSDAFRRYDYIGAPWTWHPPGQRVGNGGFSLRSRRLLEALRDDRFPAAHPEDDAIGRRYRAALEQRCGIVFAPEEVAARFAYERGTPPGPTFGFHGFFNLWRHMDAAGLAALVESLPPAVLAGREGCELAEALLRTGLRGAALRRLATCIATGLGGLDPRVRGGPAVACLERGLPSLAEHLAGHHLAAEPAQAALLHLMAVAALMGGDPQAAVRRLERAVRVAGWHAVYANSRGEALRHTGAPAAAAADFRRAVTLDPAYRPAYANLAACGGPDAGAAQHRAAVLG